MRRAARTDANHAEVVSALERVGAVVTDLSRVGEGVADLLVSYRNQWFLLEVKDGKKKPSDRKLTPDQMKWHEQQRAAVHVVLSPEAAVKAISAIDPAPPRFALDHCS